MDHHTEFSQFHTAHPEVYHQLVLLTREAKNSGFAHFGIRTVWERMRWHFAMERPTGSLWKLNDHLTSHYARLIMENESDLAGFFEIRNSRKAACDD